MQALRSARPLARATPRLLATPSLQSSCSYATAAPGSAHAKLDTNMDPKSHSVSSSGGAATLGENIIPLSNISAQWESLTESEQGLVFRQLEELQKKDWKGLSLDEKRAAYYVSFGPHGTRVPVNKPGELNKIALGVLALLAASGALWSTVRSYAREPPKTMTKEWQEATNEKAREQKINPITGVSSEGYKGKGFVQSK